MINAKWKFITSYYFMKEIKFPTQWSFKKNLIEITFHNPQKLCKIVNTFTEIFNHKNPKRDFH